MSNGWTGGQYSVFRTVLGLYLLVHFAHLAPWAAEVLSSEGALPEADASPLLRAFPNVLALFDAPWFTVALVASAAAASVPFTLGVLDRAAAVWMWYVLACVLGRNPLGLNPALSFVGWILLAHAFLPRAPYGSVAARGRADPGGGWAMPRTLFAAAWIVMAVAYSYSGATKLVSPSWVDGSALRDILESPPARATPIRELLLALPPVLLKAATWGGLALQLFFAPIALVARLRPWLWLAAVLVHAALLALIDFADITLGMLALHLFTFDPAWLRPAAAAARETVFYDGTCGLCHRAVRFLLAEDLRGAFRFAPLQGRTFEERIGEEERARLPDSVVVLAASGEHLVRFRAWLHLLRRLGGLWRLLAIALAPVPGRLGDSFYDLVARNRRRWFRQPPELCPVTPERLRERFEP